VRGAADKRLAGGERAMSPSAGDTAQPFRMLYFVRHGHFLNDDSPLAGGLTALGRKQAKRLGAHLRRYPIDSVVCSDLPRAIETARLVADALGIEHVRRRKLLREVVPVAIPGKRVPLSTRAKGKRRLHSINAELFRASRSTRHEVIVCHGNLIRALVCLVTGAPLTGLFRMRTHHAGITCFCVTRPGVKLVSYNSVVHLPTEQQTYF
jgi:serine/threonine-protein phosphatase PGAM5